MISFKAAGVGVGGRHLEGVEAATVHEQELVAQHIADRAHLALETLALAQQPRIGIRAAIGEFRELQRDEREAAKIIGRQGRRLIAFEPQAQGAAAPDQRLALRPPAGESDNDGATLGQGLAIGERDPGIRGGAAVLNERHKVSP